MKKEQKEKKPDDRYWLIPEETVREWEEKVRELGWRKERKDAE